MNVTISSIMGGATPSGPDPVAVRRALRRALAPVAIDGVYELDITLRIGGTLEPAEEHAGVHNARYFAASGRFSANLVVPLSDMEALGSAEAVGRQLLSLAERVVARVAPEDPRAGQMLRAAMESVALELAS
ncbi:hypothetical protein GCM10027416_30460 [Okibacterium endophyticum]